MQNKVTPIKSRAEQCKDFLAELMGDVIKEVNNWKNNEPYGTPQWVLNVGIQSSVKSLSPLIVKQLRNMSPEDAEQICKALHGVLMDKMITLTELFPEE